MSEISRAASWNVLLLICFGLSGLPLAGFDSRADRIQQLEWEIARHDDLYFRKGQPVISDHQYDRLVRELRDLKVAAGEPLTDAPLGDDRTGRFPEAVHEVPMLSLKKAASKEELRAHYQRMAETLESESFDLWIEPKIDGMAISAVYEEGRLVRVVSRGNGREGEVLTANFGSETGLPARLPLSAVVPERVELRGEAYIPLDIFDEINTRREADGREPFSTPRNLAAGTTRLDDPQQARARGLQVAIFGWGAWHPVESAPPDQGAFLRRLGQWGIPTPPHGRKVSGFEPLLKTVFQMQQTRSNWNLPVDGLVVKIHDTAQRDRLGNGAVAPRWAVAWKFPPPRAITTLIGISWQTGKTGRITPVAELDPVEIDGRTVSRASLHNRDYLERHGYQVGDRVHVILAGNVIPALDGVVQPDPSTGPPPEIR